MGKHQLSKAEHAALPWRVHDLLPDIPVEDVWRFPLELGPGDDLETFRTQMTAAVDGMNKGSPMALLLRLRLAIGRLFGWDRKETDVRSLQLRHRYAAAEGIDPALEPADLAGDFSLVYRLDDEYLGEIENQTVLAALHLGRVPLSNGQAAVHLAVYSLPKGWFGKAYMAFIKPFRLFIVYPAIMKAAAKRWDAHISGHSTS